VTIKEMEELAEMPRANIRFYEAEGLLSPVRSVNGYRDYSQEDLSILRKIKLLRSLHMSLEDIKALHTGQQELSSVLEQQIRKLSDDKEDLDKAQTVCEIMYQDGIQYDDLDAEKYLANLKHGVNTYNTSQNTERFSWETYWDTREAYEDTLPKIQAPWRRFFARMLDEALYSVFWSCFLILVLDINLVKRSAAANFVDALMTLLLTIILEPLQLAFFGTTLGKWILGIRVLHNDDRKLTCSEAFERTAQVLFYGLGLHIPVYNFVRMWKSYKACTERENIAWEYDSRIILKDERSFRVAVYVAVRGALVGMVLLANVLAQIPLHRGALTVAQFAQNYRQLAKYYGMESFYTLDNDGKWQKNISQGSMVIYLFEQEELPNFVFETDEEGMIRQIRFTVTNRVDEKTPKEDRPWMSDYQDLMQLASLAFVGARDEFPQFSSARKKMVSTISDHRFVDYSFTEAGVSVSCDVELQGYTPAGVSLSIPAEEGECYFYLQFTMGVER